MEDKRLTMSIAEVARELGISKPTAYALARKPGFPSIRVSENRIRVHRAKFIEWLEANVGNMGNGENT